MTKKLLPDYISITLEIISHTILHLSNLTGNGKFGSKNIAL